MIMFAVSLVTLYYAIKQYTVNGNIVSQQGMFAYKILFTIFCSLNAIILLGSFGFMIAEHAVSVFSKDTEPENLPQIAFYTFIG